LRIDKYNKWVDDYRDEWVEFKAPKKRVGKKTPFYDGRKFYYMKDEKDMEKYPKLKKLSDEIDELGGSNETAYLGDNEEIEKIYGKYLKMEPKKK